MNVLLATALICAPDACLMGNQDYETEYVDYETYDEAYREFEIYDVDYTASESMYLNHAGLSQQERQQIWNKMHFAVKKMNYYMSQASREAQQITNVNVREATIAAIEGAICGLAGSSPASVICCGCFGALARIGGDACRHFLRSKDYVREAEIWARVADELQERLWRDR